jgi:hypothetical protein
MPKDALGQGLTPQDLHCLSWGLLRDAPVSVAGDGLITLGRAQDVLPGPVLHMGHVLLHVIGCLKYVGGGRALQA